MAGVSFSGDFDVAVGGDEHSVPGNLLSVWTKARLEGFQREWEGRNVESASEKRTIHVRIERLCCGNKHPLKSLSSDGNRLLFVMCLHTSRSTEGARHWNRPVALAEGLSHMNLFDHCRQRDRKANCAPAFQASTWKNTYHFLSHFMAMPNGKQRREGAWAITERHC